MKVKKIMIGVLGISIMAVMGVVGCANSRVPSSVTNNEIDVFSAKDALKIEDIDWNVTPSIMDGKRGISFEYTNKSSYTIIDVEMKFKQKNGTTGEQLSVFDKLKSTLDWSDNDVAKIYILGYNRKCADPGEKVSVSPCVINGTYILAESMEQYEIMEPDNISIAFIGNDGKGYVVYYDYITKTYDQSSQEVSDLHQWSESKISSLLPRAKFAAVKVSSDQDNRFYFSSYGVSKDEYLEYVEEVKAKGFTKVGFEGTKSYRATNEDGIEANITYNAVEENMTGCIESK